VFALQATQWFDSLLDLVFRSLRRTEKRNSAHSVAIGVAMSVYVWYNAEVKCKHLFAK